MITVRFYTLVGKFAVTKTEDFTSEKDALAAVKAYAEAAGFSGVKIVEDGDFDGVRFTAKTPGGRGGRNVAAADYGAEDMYGDF
jgi:hypothetical protein